MIPKYFTISTAMCIGLVFIFIGIGFVGGFLFSVDKSFETGYKMAYKEMKILLEEGMNDGRDFYISSLPYKFKPNNDNKTIRVARKGKKPTENGR